MNKQLYRSNENKVLAGVCSGISEYFEIDTTIVRIIWILAIFAGIGILAYLVCWLVMPEKSYSTYTNSSIPYDQRPEEMFVDKEKSKKILGITLIIIGTVFVLNRFLPWFRMDIIIPLGIITVGIYVLLGTRRASK